MVRDDRRQRDRLPHHRMDRAAEAMDAKREMIHQALRVTPAMQAELSDQFGSWIELVGLLEADQAKMIANGALKRALYRKREAA